METRVLEGSKEQVLKATLAVLQDRGYTVTSFDYRTGLITAHSGTRGQANKTTRSDAITATVEDFGPGKARERISFVTRERAGLQCRTRPSSTPELMRQVYEEIGRELFKRRELDKQPAGCRGAEETSG
jgi:hypothetical protein